MNTNNDEFAGRSLRNKKVYTYTVDDLGHLMSSLKADFNVQNEKLTAVETSVN